MQNLPISFMCSISSQILYFRALSYDPDRDASKESAINKSPSLGVGVINGEANENKLENTNQLTIRPRSSSYGGGKRYSRQKGVHADRAPFADYTLFPDKDPKLTSNVSELKPENVII